MKAGFAISLKRPKTLGGLFSNCLSCMERKSILTLLILDEIQECNEALNALKYFCEEAPEYAVACAGSLLGIYLNHIGNSFPVGKVNHLSMYPLTFTEFLKTKDPNMYEYMRSIKEIAPLPQIFFDKLRESCCLFHLWRYARTCYSDD
jgi:predicted AAA+ superfamily ATPase